MGALRTLRSALLRKELKMESVPSSSAAAKVVDPTKNGRLEVKLALPDPRGLDIVIPTADRASPPNECIGVCGRMNGLEN